MPDRSLKEKHCKLNEDREDQNFQNGKKASERIGWGDRNPSLKPCALKMGRVLVPGKMAPNVQKIHLRSRAKFGGNEKSRLTVIGMGRKKKPGKRQSVVTSPWSENSFGWARAPIKKESGTEKRCFHRGGGALPKVLV